MPFDWSAWAPPQNLSPEDLSKYWTQHMASIQSAQQDYYKQNFWDPENALRSQFTPWTAPQWEGSSAWNTYNNYKTGMDALLARIGAGPQSSDLSQANADVAQLYGFSEASWTALQQSLPELMNASNVMAQAGNIATDMQNSPFGQQQAQAMRVAERQATEAVGKQLEAIFGERGGLAGFQAAYDLTSQIQSTFVQQAAQNSLQMFDRAVAQVNAQNGYYQDLISKGAIQAQDYLNFRWSALQQGYQDYATQMDQTLKTWQMQEQVSQQEWQATQDNIQRQIDALDKQLASEMGFDQNQMDTLTAAYADAAKASDQPNGGAQALGATFSTIGGALFTAGLNPAGLATGGTVNVGLMVIGGLFYGVGALLSWLGGK